MIYQHSSEEIQGVDHELNSNNNSPRYIFKKNFIINKISINYLYNILYSYLSLVIWATISQKMFFPPVLSRIDVLVA